MHTDDQGNTIGATDVHGRQIDIPAGFDPNGKAVKEVVFGWPTPIANDTGFSGFKNAQTLKTDEEIAANTPAGNPVGQGFADAGFGGGGSRSGAGGQPPVPGSGGGSQVPVPGEEGGGSNPPGPYKYGFSHGSQPLPGNVLNLDPEALLEIMFGGGDSLVRRPPRLGSPYRDSFGKQAARLVGSPGLFNSQGDSASNFAVRNAGANAFGIQRQQAQGQISKQRGNLFFGAVNDLRRNDDINRNDLMQMLLGYKTNQNRLAQEGAHFDQSLEQRASEFNRNLEFNVQTARGNRGEQKRNRFDSYVDAFAGLAAALVPLLGGRNTGTVRGGNIPNQYGGGGFGGYGGFG